MEKPKASNSSVKPDEAYEKILTTNLQRALDFLRFAEAKNAALLAASILALNDAALREKLEAFRMKQTTDSLNSTLEPE